MDGKGRIALPSRWRSSFLERDPQRKVFIVRDQNMPCLDLIPYAAYAPKLMEFADRLNVIESGEERMKLRLLTARAVDAEFDEQWRLLIPQDVRRQVALPSSLVAIGSVNRIELWDPEVWNRYEAAAALNGKA